jgi:6-carboxyhexanoate--CoA ligase
MAMIISCPMSPSLYSVRMRASSHGRHLAGAERIVPADAVAETTAALTSRAMRAPLGPPDIVHCSSEQIDPATVQLTKLLDVRSYQVESWQAGRQAAMQLLLRAGLTKAIASQAVATLAEGAGPGGVVMRGAVIMDAVTGERLERDQARGVRVSRMDLLSECRPDVESLLASASLDHYRVLEALLLAGKVSHAPGIVAELCWSDAPDYVTGYVAAPQFGYQRISQMKMAGDSRGGRVFFVDLTNVTLQTLVDYLERQPVLFNKAGTIYPLQKWEPDNE